jgi:uncharacterized glyoxalase superfamily protein PhnB
MTKATNYKPKGASDIVPHLVIKNAAKAIEFYKKAFGAQEVHSLLTPDGRVMHAGVTIGDAMIFFSDEFPENKACGMSSPETLKGSHATIHIYVPEVDKVYEQAIKAGATSIMAPQQMFWGDRYGVIVDPFGQHWSVSTHTEDLTPEEIKKGAAECMKQAAAAK